MAAMMAVNNKKYKKIIPETGKLQEFACKILFYLFLNYKHHPLNVPVILLIHHSEYDILKVASRMLPDKFYSPVGAASYL